MRLPFSSSTTQTFVPFQLIHADVWTSPEFSFSGYKYYLVLIDDFTDYVWTFPLRHKSEVLPLIQSFHAYVRTQFGLPLIALQAYNGRELDSTALRLFFSTHGVAFRLSCPYTSQQNGKAERTLCTINDCVRTLLIHIQRPADISDTRTACITIYTTRTNHDDRTSTPDDHPRVRRRLQT